MSEIVLENGIFSLVIGCDCKVKSLILKKSGENCVYSEEAVPLFSLTEDRPYNNEIKLSHPNKRTEFNAERVRLEGDKLIVGFELVTFEAVVSVKLADRYIAFTLENFLVKPSDFEGLDMSPPPVSEFRLVQLPIKKRSSFGEWLNVSFDENAAVNVLAASPCERIDCNRWKRFDIMTADAVRDVKLKGCTAAIIVSETDKLLDAIEDFENDYNLPKGVKSRRSDCINASSYWVRQISPDNIDWHIEQAKRGGFKMMLLAHPSFIRYEKHGFHTCGDYELRPEYGGIEGLSEFLGKIKKAGIIPGFHFLHTHIGIETKYVSPVADHRLNLTRHFTLADSVGNDDDVIYVEQNPAGTVMHEKCRVLKFDGELIYYESYTTEPPYCFTGCKRGHFGTYATAHTKGTIGGILDISEFSATSVYIDQNTSLQDEIADNIARIYNAGFEYAYFDGSEGTNPPFEYQIPNAQYKVYKKLVPEPLYSEGAAKSHFSWHMISGGNAFDVFPMNTFKKKIAQHPLEEASRMQNDFTRVNFGWWAFKEDTMPDMFEYGTSKAASYDCPGTMRAEEDNMRANPRTDDILEVMRRWEDVRAKKWLKPEQKLLLRNADEEYTLLINESGGYELVKYERIENAAGGDKRITAYFFERAGKSCIVLWHTKGDGCLKLQLNAGRFEYLDELCGSNILTEAEGEYTKLPVAGKRYIISELDRNTLVKAIENAELL